MKWFKKFREDYKFAKRQLKEKRISEKSKYKVAFAFNDGHGDLFEFDDTFNLPYQRGLTAVTFYRELQMNVDSEFLKAHGQALMNLCNKNMEALIAKNGNFNLTAIVTHTNDIKALTAQLTERTEMIKDPDLIYKLASVVFFYADENPIMYEHKFNMKKIERWKKSQSMHDFFLQMPIQKLVPFLKHSASDIQQYSATIMAMEQMKKVTQLNWENISGSSLSEQKTI